MSRPLVTLKLATSLDGRIATAGGESRWITGEAARLQGRRLRAEHDAVLVGIGTALADDPELTVRGAAPGPEPWRIVLDSQARLPKQARLFAAPGGGRVCVLAGGGAAPDRIRALEAVGAVVRQIGADELGLRIAEALAVLDELGLRRVFVEGGGQVAGSFLRADAVDRVEWFRAGLVLGADGLAAIGPLGKERLAQAPRFRRVDFQLLGDDVWERYEREETGCSPAS